MKLSLGERVWLATASEEQMALRDMKEILKEVVEEYPRLSAFFTLLPKSNPAFKISGTLFLPLKSIVIF